MTIKNVLVKPTLKVTDRQWRKLMARIFEREQKASMQTAKYGLEGPKPQVGMVNETPEDILRYPKEERVMGPREMGPEPLPGHRLGGSLPMQDVGGLGRYSVKEDTLANILNPTGLEYPPEVTRRYRFGLGQSEEVARAVAEARRGGMGRYIDEEGLELPPLPMKSRGPTPSKKGALKERRGIKDTALRPGATLPPNMQKAVQKGGYLPTAAEMMTFKPPITRKYGRLIEQTEEGPIPRSLPWAGAAKLLKKMPGRFTEHSGSTPPADILRLRERGKSTYERRVFRPLTSDVERATRTSELVAKEQERATKLLGRQKEKEAKVVGASTTHLEGKKAVGAVDKDRLWKEALLADSIWKNYIGGMRTLTGRTWQDFLAAEARKKSSIRLDNTTPRDFFQIVLLKYLHEPESSLVKRYGQPVVNSIKRILAEVEKEHGSLFAQ